MHQTSATLMLRLKADGDAREVAWEEFCRLYEPIIAGFARRMGLPPGQIADLVQQVVLGFFAAQPRFCYEPSKGRFRGYLKACVSHEIQRLRTSAAAASRRERAVAGLDETEDLEADGAWEAEWESHLLAEAMERVRAHYRGGPTFEAFERTFVLNQAPETVAGELGISRDSVYQAKSRVLAKLQIEMATLAEKMGE